MDLPRMTATRVDSNPHMANSQNMDNWRCTLAYKGRRMSVFFSMGMGHNGKAPTLKDVLDCLFADDTGSSFNDWCANFGYDTDSRTAERTYKTCLSQSIRLRKLLGSDFRAIASSMQEA